MHPGQFKRYLSVLIIIGTLTGYVTTVVGEYQISPSTATVANPFLNPYEARSYPEKLEIYHGDKKVSVIRSEKLSIDQWGFIDSGNLVVVKSKGENGLTVYELFETATGALKDKAVQSEANDGLPIWVVDFVE